MSSGAGFEPATSGITQDESGYYRKLRETGESLVLKRCPLSLTLPVVTDPHRLRSVNPEGKRRAVKSGCSLHEWVSHLPPADVPGSGRCEYVPSGREHLDESNREADQCARAQGAQHTDHLARKSRTPAKAATARESGLRCRGRAVEVGWVPTSRCYVHIVTHSRTGRGLAPPWSPTRPRRTEARVVRPGRVGQGAETVLGRKPPIVMSQGSRRGRLPWWGRCRRPLDRGCKSGGCRRSQ
jgi:hypothetical protein